MRFISLDRQFFQTRMIVDPQYFNLFIYARGNPTKYLDPTGKAIELTGNEEQRKKQLNAIKAAVGFQAGTYLYENKAKNGKFYVGIYTNGPTGNSKPFEKMNFVAKEFSQIIKDKQVAHMSIVRSTEELPLKISGKEFGRSLRDLCANGASTCIGGEDNRQVWVFLKDPTEGYQDTPGEWMSDGNPGENNAGFVTAHEFGHVHYYFFSEVFYKNNIRNNESALDLENTARQLNNIYAPIRVVH